MKIIRHHSAMLVIFAIFFLLPLLKVKSAALIPMAFWQAPALKIITATQTLYPNVCSTPISIQSWMGGKTKTPGGSGLVVNLSGTGTLTFYSDSSCTVPITSSTIGFSSTQTNVYAMVTAVGTPTLTAQANAYVSATQGQTAITNPYIWTGNAGDNIWKTAGNWSGGVAPTATSVAVFDGTCATYCSPNITANVAIQGVKIFSGFTGTITQNTGYTITLNAHGWVQAAGSFVGSSGGDAITIGNAGPFYVSGGTFTSTTGTITATTEQWYIGASGTFNANGGTVTIAASSSAAFAFTPGSGTYNTFNFNSTYNVVTLTGTLNVAGTLTLGNSSIYSTVFSGGTINPTGNIAITGNGVTGSTTTLNVAGTGSQSIDASAATIGNLPSLNILSTGGTVSLIGNIYLSGSYTYTSGTVSMGTSTLTFAPTATGQTITPGTLTYNNVTFASTYNFLYDITLSGTLTVGGTLTLADTNASVFGVNGGTVKALGNVTATNYGLSGTTTLSIAGTASQTFDATALSAGALLPALTIQSTGGTVTLLGTLTVYSSYQVTSGTLSASTANIVLQGTNPGTFAPGTTSYNSLWVYSTSGSGGVVNVTTNMNASSSITVGKVGSTNTINMPNPGTSYSITTAGTLTVNTGTTLNLHGATKTYGTLTNNGTIIP